MEFEGLLENLRILDRRSFDTFVHRYYNLVHYLTRRKLSIEADREDVVQEVFLKFFQQNLFAKFTGETEGQFKAYIARVALNTLYDHHRKNYADSHRLTVFDPHDPIQTNLLGLSESPETLFAAAQLRDRLNEEIGKLPEHAATAIQLRLMGYTNQEIAEIMQKPLGSIASWIDRALKAMKKNLEDLKAEL